MMQLTPAERQDPLWRKLAQILREQLAELRAKNDAPDLGERETAVLRGRIKQVKAILALGEEERTPRHPAARP